MQISLKEQTYTYPISGTFEVTSNESEGKLTVKSENEEIAKVSIRGTTVTVEPQNKAGTVNIVVTSAANGKYSEGRVTHKAIVENGEITLDATAYTGNYDGKAHNAITSVDVNPSDAKIEYALGTGEYSTEIPQVTGASTYTVAIRASKTGYADKEISKTVTLGRVTTATVTYADKLYNEAEQIGVTGENVTLTGTIKATNVGTYTAYATPNENYAWSDGTTDTKTITWKITQSVAKIGTTYYATLQNAINAAPNSTATTITLIANTTESDISIASTKNISLNVNSKTITGNINNAGKLTIGGGNITGSYPLTNTGTLVINSGTYTATGGHCVNNYGTLTFNGGTISLPLTGGQTALYSNSGTVRMNGGTISTNSYGLVIHGGTGTVTGGTISASSAHCALLVRNTGSASVSNTTIKQTGSGYAVYNALGYGYCIIYSRASNYGISGSIAGKVLATTNTSTGQAQENITIYNTGYTQLSWPTWTVNNGQDDITWEKTSSSSGNHTYTVRKSAHGNETGTYYIHIYSYVNETSSYICGFGMTF